MTVLIMELSWYSCMQFCTKCLDSFCGLVHCEGGIKSIKMSFVINIKICTLYLCVKKLRIDGDF